MTKEKRHTQKAVALTFDDDRDSAPRIIAKGEGTLAAKIAEVAQKSGVPIRRDNDLVEILSQIDLNQEVPPELYAAVAELLSWVYRANESIRKEVFE